MSLAGFTHIGDYTLPALTGVHTNFPVLLRYDDFHPDVIAALEADARDLRLSLSDDTQIAHHVVRWNPATNDILVHCCLPSASGTPVIKLWGDNPSATMLPVTDPYGQYEAYKWFVWYTHDGKNNVANANTLAYSGSEPDGISPFSGTSTGFDGIDDYTGNGVSYDLDIQQTFVAMAKADTFPASGYGAIIGIVQSTDNNRHAMLAVDSSGKARANKDRYTSDGAQGATTLSTGTWYHLGATFGAWGTVDHKVYVDGSLDGTSNQENSARYVNVNLFRIGNRDGLDPFDGEIAHAGMRQYREESAEWMNDHSSNLKAVGAWGTMTSVGGGGGLSILPTGISSLEAFGTSTVTVGAVTIEATAIPTEEAFGTAIVTSGASLIVPSSVTSEEVFGLPVLAAGAVLLEPASIDTEEALGSVTITLDAVVVSATGIATAELFGTALVQLLLQIVNPTGVPTAQAVGNATVLGGDRIVIPVPDRENWTKVANYLKDLTFEGSTNDIIYKWLGSLGYEGAIEDRWAKFFSDEGYFGAYNDKYYLWRNGVTPPDWILTGGTWDDTNNWVDQQVWED